MDPHHRQNRVPPLDDEVVITTSRYGTANYNLTSRNVGDASPSRGFSFHTVAASPRRRVARSPTITRCTDPRILCLIHSVRSSGTTAAALQIMATTSAKLCPPSLLFLLLCCSKIIGTASAVRWDKVTIQAQYEDPNCGNGKQINIAEVQFFSFGQQVPQKNLTSSLTSEHGWERGNCCGVTFGSASFATDGDLLTFAASADYDSNPTLTIVPSSPISSDRIVIYNRQDNNCMARINSDAITFSFQGDVQAKVVIPATAAGSYDLSLPTSSPTLAPSGRPSESPTVRPSVAPSVCPSGSPSAWPTSDSKTSKPIRRQTDGHHQSHSTTRKRETVRNRGIINVDVDVDVAVAVSKGK